MEKTAAEKENVEGEETRSRRADEGKCDVCRSHKEQEGWKEKLESRAASIPTMKESYFWVNSMVIPLR